MRKSVLLLLSVIRERSEAFVKAINARDDAQSELHDNWRYKYTMWNSDLPPAAPAK